MVPLSKFVNFMAFGLKHEPNTIAGKLLHDTQVTYKARGPLVYQILGRIHPYENIDSILTLYHFINIKKLKQFIVRIFYLLQSPIYPNIITSFLGPGSARSLISEGIFSI